MAEDDAGQQQQQDDGATFEKVTGFIRDQVKQYAEEYVREAVGGRQQQLGQPTPDELARQQLQATLDPFIAPGLNEARLTSADAKDYVDFYTGDDVPGKMEYKDQVEQTFNQLKERGRPTTRQDIYKYLVGKEALEKPDDYVAKVSARKQAQLDRANSAVDMGGFSATRAKADSQFSNFESKTVEEMEQLLEGVAF